MEEQGRANLHKRPTFSPATPHLVAVWKQLQFDITLKDTFQTDSTSSRAPATAISNCQYASHNDYTFIGWKNKDGKTFTKDGSAFSPPTPLWLLSGSSCSSTSPLKDSFQTDSVIKGASNGKFTLPVRKP
jgi:hypothetical protein